MSNTSPAKSRLGVLLRRAARSKAATTVPTGKNLLERKVLDATLTKAKAVFAAFCWINSFVTSAATGAQIQLVVWRYRNPFAPADWSPVAWQGALLGLVLQALFTFGQLYTAERAPGWYRACLFPDAAATGFQWGYWVVYPVLIALLSLVISNPRIALFAALAGTVAIVAPLGVYSAKWPEKMIFGTRRSAG